MTDIGNRVPTIYLHIGPMKTGTSYLQQLMANNQDVLRSQGVLFPGRNPRVDQVRAVRDVMGLNSNEDTTPAKLQGAWARLREEMLDFDGRASIVSQEFLSFARGPRAREIIRSLAPADVHVVLTVRDTARVLPSSWTTSTRNGGTASWQEFVDALRAGPRKGGAQWRRSMRAANMPRMLKDWRRHVPADRLHVVVVPPPGAPHSRLWERFASVLGVAPERAHLESGRRAESYGYHSADFMRRVNLYLAHQMNAPHPTWQRTTKYLLKEVLNKRRAAEPKVPITPQVLEFAQRWNGVTLDAIRSSGARVHGDLADLDSTAVTAVEQAGPPSTQDLLLVAVDGLSGLRHLMRVEYHHVVADDDRVEPQRWIGESDPVAAAVRDVAEALGEAEGLRVDRAASQRAAASS